MALMEGWEQHAICDFIKLLFTSLTLQGQLVGGSLVWCTEPEYTTINRRNKEEVKPPQLDHNRNTFFLTAFSEFLEMTKQEAMFFVCTPPHLIQDRCEKYSNIMAVD